MGATRVLQEEPPGLHRRVNLPCEAERSAVIRKGRPGHISRGQGVLAGR